MSALPEGVTAVAGAEWPRPNQPERELLVALLHGAIADLADQRPAKARLREQARLWIDGSAAKITFQTACELLGIDADAARVALLDADHPERAAVLFQIGAAAAA